MITIIVNGPLNVEEQFNGPLNGPLNVDNNQRLMVPIKD